MFSLSGKKALIVGITNEGSIAALYQEWRAGGRTHAVAEAAE